MSVLSRFGKLQWKVSLLLAFSLVVLMAVFSLFFQHYLKNQIYEVAARNSSLIADTIHLSLAQSMINNNRGSIQLSLKDILNNPEIDEVLIFDNDRKVVFSSEDRMIGRNLRHSSYFDISGGKGWKVSSPGDGRTGEILRFSPIPNRPSCSPKGSAGCHTSAHAKIGDIALKMSLDSSDEILSRTWFLLILLVPVVVASVTLISERIISHYVKAPVKEFLDRFREVSVGKYALSVSQRRFASDEIGNLRGRFEELLREMQNAHESEIGREKEIALGQREKSYLVELESLRHLLMTRETESNRADSTIRSLEHQLDEKNENLQNAIKNISSLNRVGMALSSELDIDKLVKLLVNISVKGLRAEIGYIMLMDADEGKLVMRAWTGMEQGFDHSLTIDPGDSISGRVAADGKPLMLQSFDGSDGISRSSRFGYTRKSVISVPIKMKNRLLGVIELSNKRGGENFVDDDLAMMRSIANQAAVAIDNANNHREVQKSYFDTIRALVQAVEETDRYTRGHSERVTTFSMKIAEKLEFSEIQMKIVQYGGVLHDIGKIGIDVNILQKPSCLTREEYEIIKDHPLIGMRIIAPIAFLKDVLSVVSQHHEKYDGTGYPLGIKGDKIVAEARVLAVADAYDAMITARPYRDPLPKRDAVAELRRCSGTQFDALVVEAFLELLEEDSEILELESRLANIGT